MQKELKLIVIALCFPFVTFAQNPTTEAQKAAEDDDDAAFTLTEAQLNESDDVLNSISIVGSTRNVYAKDVGFRFSAARFKYRALDSKYNEVFINGNPVNDVERGSYNFSFLGGLNNQTRNATKVLPFEDNNFSMPSLAGSNDFNLRPSSMPAGSRFGLSGGNRNYVARAMFSYNSGVSKDGWIFSGALTYRWANMDVSNVKGTFYNSLSYYLGIEKILNPKHSISFATWGNPTERAAQSASTDEMYWIANDRHYNPNWGYQDGKKRSSRIVKSFSPAGIFTWDWKINESTKLVTSLLGKYQKYSSTRLNYNNSTNPAPDYYSLMPSNWADCWINGTTDPTDLANWQAAYDYLSSSENNRQINWDKLYYANKGTNAAGTDAMYYLQAYHDDQLAFTLSSNFTTRLKNQDELKFGLSLSTNKGMHYQTMEDLLGANTFHNVNTYAVGTYAEDADEIQYDLNNHNALVRVGDRFGYDYNILVNKATLWATYAGSFWGGSRGFISGRITGTSIQRDGKMRNGLFPTYSYGKSGTAKFLDGGAKTGFDFNLGKGHHLLLGMSLESKAPTARTAFISPQMNNDFVKDLKSEIVFGLEASYNVTTPWMQASLNAYFNHMGDVTEYSMAYSDAEHSFTYISLTDIQKQSYGLELGMNFKLTEWFNVKALGTISEAKYVNNADAVYMRSDAKKDKVTGNLYSHDTCLNKDIREGGTPLAAVSLDLNYHNKGWFNDLIGNYYDRIYLYYSPIVRLQNMNTDSNGNYNGPTEQQKGKGGFMLDASIGKSMFLKKGRSLSINIMLSNLLNNTKICTGGMEQNRTSYNDKGDRRNYAFDLSPKKFYVFGINGMLNVTYKF